MTETTATRLFRLRTSYVKHGRLAYLGHLELCLLYTSRCV